ncbi:hypothetical protein ACN47E_008761 [Coniothyrium glycines]
MSKSEPSQNDADDSLCQRCKTLGIEQQIQKWSQSQAVSTYDIVVPPRSCHLSCSLCTVFYSIWTSCKDFGWRPRNYMHFYDIPRGAKAYDIDLPGLIDGKIGDRCINTLQIILHQERPDAHEENAQSDSEAQESTSQAVATPQITIVSVRFCGQGAFLRNVGVLHSSSLTKRENSVNINRAFQWLKTCKDASQVHHRLCRPSASIKAARIKVIDCLSREVRSLRPKEPYLCLSYVWGTSKVFEDSGSGRILKALPKTIEDSIHLAIELGVPQLWVDQYCIDQANFLERHNTIAAMNLIYGGAELTIVASSGSNADSGLAGVCGTPLDDRNYVDIGEYKYSWSSGTRVQVAQSRWNSRGWTFQEALLSPRRLVFTGAAMYFQCRVHHCPDDLETPVPNSQMIYSRSLQIFPINGVPKASDCLDAICEYYTKHLSFASDRLYAAEGFLQAFGTSSYSSETVKHFYGIPIFCGTSEYITIRVGPGLAWRASRPISRDEVIPAGTEDAELPSWTWAARKTASPGPNDRIRFVTEEVDGFIQAMSCTLTHRDGRVLKIWEYMKNTPSIDYTDVNPWINTRTYILRCKKASADTETSYILDVIGGEAEGVYLDYTETAPESSVAIYLGISLRPRYRDRHVLLVAREVSPGQYSRLGLWCPQSESTSFSDIHQRRSELFEQLAKRAHRTKHKASIEPKEDMRLV